jgi:hypothetical protein
LQLVRGISQSFSHRPTILVLCRRRVDFHGGPRGVGALKI